MLNHIDFLIEKFHIKHENIAIVYNEKSYSYKYLLERIFYHSNKILELNIKKGAVVSIIGDFSPECISLILALINNRNIIVPLTHNNKNIHNLLKISEVDFVYRQLENDHLDFEVLESSSIKNSLYSTVIQRESPGLVIFSSGTSGLPKCAVHDFSKLLKKFKEPKRSLKTLNFLLFDHWGGLNTMFHILANCGVIITTKNRTPDEVCKLIETYQIELLPASPTFLNLLILLETYKKYNLSSLKIISYGSEPMLQITLDKLKNIFPNIKLLQTYGLIELGVLNSRSKEDNSLWVKLGGEGYDLRVVDGLLEIKAESAMLGYLNAESPFTADGWFKTGDAVEVDGEYYKILGRKSELINIGGEKVYPIEIENIIQNVSNVAEVTVKGEKSPLLGTFLVAYIKLVKEEDKNLFKKRVKEFCRERLEPFKIPVKIEIVNEFQIGDRLKKKRI